MEGLNQNDHCFNERDSFATREERQVIKKYDTQSKTSMKKTASIDSMFSCQ